MKVCSNITSGNAMLYYEILENGFDIYVGETSSIPIVHQYEPFIPNPDISYEDNAINMCKELATPVEKIETPVEERLTNVEANIDYLMLLNDADCATEEETE